MRGRLPPESTALCGPHGGPPASAAHFSEVDAPSHPPADTQGSRGVGLGGDRSRFMGAAEPLGHRTSPDNWSRTWLCHSLCRLRQITQHPLPAIVSASVE